MSRVANVLNEKGRTLHTIAPVNTVFDAIEKMVALEIGSLVVVDGGDIVGIVTERDYLKKIALLGRSSRTTPVAEIMTSTVHSVPTDMTIEECLAMMTAARHRHMLVREGDRMVGLVSIGDLVKYLVRDQQADIDRLTDFICNRYPA